MISAIVTALNDERGLAATLSCLTTAAVDGFVREVIVADGGTSAAVLEIAEDTGARWVRGPVDVACPLAKQPWLLILPAGVRLQMGWEPAVRAHIKRHPETAGWFRLNYTADGLGPRLEEAWANGVAQVLARPRADHGLLISARQWAASSGRGRGGRPIGARILVGGADLG
ncbi:MAG TPA: hypothetical protein VGI79_07880 [Caulobacteraceae bacterium]